MNSIMISHLLLRLLSTLILLCSIFSHGVAANTINTLIHFQYNYIEAYLVCGDGSTIFDQDPTWRYKQDSADSHQNPELVFDNDVQIDNNGRLLVVNNMNATKEGVFSCVDSNDNVVEYFNVTVYGLPQFTGCLNPLLYAQYTSCNHDTVYSAATGEAIHINISFQYYGAGNRGVVQDIYDIRVLRADNVPLFYCVYGKNCIGVDEAASRINFTYTGHYDIQVTLTNANFSDTGEYTALAQFTTVASILTSYLTINVTSSISTPTSSYTSSPISTPASISTLSSSSISTTSSAITTTNHFITSPSSSVLSSNVQSRSTTSHQSHVLSSHATVSPSAISSSTKISSSINHNSDFTPSINANSEGSVDPKVTVFIVVGCVGGLVIFSVFILIVICVLKSKTELTSLTKLFPVKDKYTTSPHCTFSDKTSITNKSYSMTSIRVENEPVYDRPRSNGSKEYTLSHEHNSQQVIV